MKRLLLLLVLSVCAVAQTTILMPAPKIQFFDFVGNPLSGGQVFTYQAGTSIPQATYADSTGNPLLINSDPIILDAAGFPSSPLGPGQQAGIYFINGASYRICVFNSNSVQQYCSDNVKLVSSTTLAGAANTQVLFDCAGLICGNAGFTFNAGTQTLSVVGLNVSAGGSLNGTFSGNPTFSGTVTFSGNLVVNTLTVTTLSSACTPTATTGFIRMCSTDLIAWRNTGNSADYTLGIEPVTAALQVTHLGGILMSGANDRVRFGGNTNAFPMLKPVGTQIQARLADDSAFAPIYGSTLTYDNSGVVISGPCTTGQVLTAASNVSVTCATQGAAILQHASTTTIVNATVGNSNTTVFSKAITMPSTGCPCRVVATWWAYLNEPASGQTAAMVSDGTNTFAGAEVATTGGAQLGINGAGTSPTTYANGATPTFTLTAASSHAGSTTFATAPQGTVTLTGAPAASLVLDILGSN